MSRPKACFGLALLLASVLSACAPATDEVIRLGIAAAPSTLDPRFATDATSVRINRLLYARLIDFDAALRPVPALATWEQVSPLHYRFRLGTHGRSFHDGSRLSADDVVATYQYVLDADNASPHRGALTMIEQVTAPDPDTVEFRLSKADAVFPGRLTLGIVPRLAMRENHPLNSQPIGSGPFRFIGWPSDDRVLLERISDAQRVEILRIGDPTVRSLKIARGEVDLLQNDLPSELIGWLDARDDISVTHGRGSNFSYLGFNLEDPVTGKLAVRQAIAHAIDREAIIRYVFNGGARLAEALLPPDHWAGHDHLAPWPHNPERARELLREAGYDENNRVTLIYKTSSDPFRIRLATIIQHQLSAVNIDVDLRSYDWGTFYGDIKAGRFQMYSLAWVGIKTPDIFRYVFHSSAIPPGGANRGRLRSADVDALIEQAEAAPGLREQGEVYGRLQAELHAALPYVPLWYEDHVLAMRTGITGYQLARDGNFDGLITVRRTRDTLLGLRQTP